jgi:similar to spore coat protein
LRIIIGALQNLLETLSTRGEGMVGKIALHERLEVQEILAFKNLCLTKSSMMKGLVGCEELKSILTMDATEGKQHVEQLTELLKEREVVS